MSVDTQRVRAYRAGARITRERLSREAPAEADALASVEAADIVVVPGSYDHVELVLGALDLPYTRIEAEALGRTRLRPEQLLVINCPGHIDEAGVRAVERFVAAGGSLFTTDWALSHVIEQAFPGVLAYNGRPTADDVVRVEVCDHENPFLQGVLDADDDPVWWLEGSSYPIQIVDPTRVRVLLTSKELGDKYGEAPVAVLFYHGEGEVFHMISHYFLQRTELRDARQQGTASSYAAEKGITPSPAMAADLDGLTLGEVESASTSTRWLANVVAAKKLRTSAEAGESGTGAAR